MARARLLGCLSLGAFALAFAPLESAAQSGLRVDASAGPLWADSKADNCDPLLGLGVGVQVSGSHGPLLLGMALDLLTSGLVDCKDVGKVVNFQEQQVEVYTTVGFLGPRFGPRAGFTLDLGGFVIEPALGAGLMPVHTNFAGKGEWLWTKWYGSTLHVVAPTLPVGFMMEWGWREVPIRYIRGPELVHEFNNRVRMIRLVATLDRE